MTIAAAYLTSEGVVFGADSSTTVTATSPAGEGAVLQLLNHAQKVFEIGAGSRIGACTWGSGSFGNLSHRTLIAQVAERIDQDRTTIREAAELLAAQASPLLAQTTGQNYVGYYVGGWDPGTHIPSCFQLDLSRGQEPRITALPQGNCSFSGAPQFFSRVFRGYDQRLQGQLLTELTRRLPHSPDQPGIEAIFNDAFQAASRPLLAAGYQDLPIREAIDFVYSYLHITVKALKFSFGAPTAGGPIEIGFITSDRKFRWVRHKSFASAIIEEEADEFGERPGHNGR